VCRVMVHKHTRGVKVILDLTPQRSSGIHKFAAYYATPCLAEQSTGHPPLRFGVPTYLAALERRNQGIVFTIGCVPLSRAHSKIHPLPNGHRWSNNNNSIAGFVSRGTTIPRRPRSNFVRFSRRSARYTW